MGKIDRRGPGRGFRSGREVMGGGTGTNVVSKEVASGEGVDRGVVSNQNYITTPILVSEVIKYQVLV